MHHVFTGLYMHGSHGQVLEKRFQKQAKQSHFCLFSTTTGRIDPQCSY
jgi:hypothetical protein